MLHQLQNVTGNVTQAFYDDLMQYIRTYFKMWEILLLLSKTVQSVSELQNEVKMYHLPENKRKR